MVCLLSSLQPVHRMPVRSTIHLVYRICRLLPSFSMKHYVYEPSRLIPKSSTLNLIVYQSLRLMSVLSSISRSMSNSSNTHLVPYSIGILSSGLVSFGLLSFGLLICSLMWSSIIWSLIFALLSVGLSFYLLWLGLASDMFIWFAISIYDHRISHACMNVWDMAITK